MEGIRSDEGVLLASGDYVEEAIEEARKIYQDMGKEKGDPKIGLLQRAIGEDFRALESGEVEGEDAEAVLESMQDRVETAKRLIGCAD